MTPALLGTKIGMTRIYDDKGNIVPVTVVQAGPCAVTQVKTVESRWLLRRAARLRRCQAASQHIPADGPLCEIRDVAEEIFPRDQAQRSHHPRPRRYRRGRCVYSDVKFVDVIGTSKGKGTAGVMKRHHFGGQPASHGTERKHRSPGSLASRATWRGQSGKPKKGVRMAGHMGMDNMTVVNHPLVKIDTEKNLLLIKGALPGPNGALLFVRKAITAKVKKAAE